MTASADTERSGLELMRGIAAGELPPPPVAELLEFSLDRVDEGNVVFSMAPLHEHTNPLGTVHGGIITTLLDSAMGCAVHTTLEAGVGYTSIELKVSYLRPVHAHSGELTAHGWVTKPGRRVAFAEGDVRDADGKLLATGSSSLLIIRPDAAAPPER